MEYSVLENFGLVFIMFTVIGVIWVLYYADQKSKENEYIKKIMEYNTKQYELKQKELKEQKEKEQQIRASKINDETFFNSVI